MPYATVEDLPSEVRDALPAEAQAVFLAAFNDAYEKCGDAGDREGCSSRAAWAAVRTKTEIQNVSSFGPTSTIAPDTHEAILQGLNQWLPTPHEWVKGGKTYLGVRNFTGTEPAWDQVPLIYVPGAPKHPSNRGLRENLEAEVARVGGRLAGRMAGTTLHQAGTPRLSSLLVFSDPEVQQLHAEGNLGLSTGFDSFTFPSGHLAGTVEPSHVLLFDLRHGTPPNDPRTMFLNLGDPDMADDAETRGLLTRILSILERPAAAPPAAHTNTAPADTARLIEQANLEKAKTEKELADAKAKLEEYQNLEKKRQAEEADGLWLEVKNALPKGETHKPEDEAKLRQEWEANPTKFALRLVSANLNRAPEKPAQGISHYNGPAPEKTDEARLDELGIPSIVISGGA